MFHGVVVGAKPGATAAAAGVVVGSATGNVVDATAAEAPEVHKKTGGFIVRTTLKTHPPREDEKVTLERETAEAFGDASKTAICSEISADVFCDTRERDLIARREDHIGIVNVGFSVLPEPGEKLRKENVVRDQGPEIRDLGIERDEIRLVRRRNRLSQFLRLAFERRKLRVQIRLVTEPQARVDENNYKKDASRKKKDAR